MQLFTILDNEKLNDSYMDSCAYDTSEFRYRVVYTRDLVDATQDFDEGDEERIYYQSVFFSNDLELVNRELDDLRHLHCTFDEVDSMMFRTEDGCQYSILVSDKFELFNDNFYCELRKRYVYKVVKTSYCLADIMNEYEKLTK